MNSSQQADNTRRNIAGIIAIVLGLVIGFFIKKVRLGLIIGIALGFITYSLLRKR
jgi:uncharacterized membrane protein HdeD (DUF308 family)